ncbi:Bgt-20473-2, partial [Blumeria graminis f. sp. tritici]
FPTIGTTKVLTPESRLGSVTVTSLSLFGVRDSTGTWRDVIPVGYSLTHRPCSHCNCWSMGLGSGLILGLDLDC